MRFSVALLGGLLHGFFALISLDPLRLGTGQVPQDDDDIRDSGCPQRLPIFANASEAVYVEGKSFIG